MHGVRVSFAGAGKGFAHRARTCAALRLAVRCLEVVVALPSGNLLGRTAADLGAKLVHVENSHVLVDDHRRRRHRVEQSDKPIDGTVYAFDDRAVVAAELAAVRSRAKPARDAALARRPASETRRRMLSIIAANERERSPTSSLPRVSSWTAVSPAAIRSAAAASRRTGFAMLSAITYPSRMARRNRRHAQPDHRSRRRANGADELSVRVLRRLLTRSHDAIERGGRCVVTDCGRSRRRSPSPPGRGRQPHWRWCARGRPSTRGTQGRTPPTDGLLATVLESPILFDGLVDLGPVVAQPRELVAPRPAIEVADQKCTLGGADGVHARHDPSRRVDGRHRLSEMVDWSC